MQSSLWHLPLHWHVFNIWNLIHSAMAFAASLTCVLTSEIWYIRQLSYCRMCADCHLPGTLCMWTDCTTCFESCGSAAGECGCLGSAGDAGLPLLLVMALIVLGLFTVIGVFYSVLVATMVGQRIWQRHYHILAKRMLTKVSITFVFACIILSWPLNATCYTISSLLLMSS